MVIVFSSLDCQTLYILLSRYFFSNLIFNFICSLEAKSFSSCQQKLARHVVGMQLVIGLHCLLNEVNLFSSFLYLMFTLETEYLDMVLVVIKRLKFCGLFHKKEVMCLYMCSHWNVFFVFESYSYGAKN